MFADERINAMSKYLTITFVLLLGVVATAQNAFKRDFSADLITHSAGHDSTARYYASQTRSRMEIIRNGKVASVMLIDTAKKQAWQLRPQRKLAMDMSSCFLPRLLSNSKVKSRIQTIRAPHCRAPRATSWAAKPSMDDRHKNGRSRKAMGRLLTFGLIRASRSR